MKSLSLALLIIATLVATCNKSNDDNNPGGGGGGGGGNLSISSTSPEYAFWGQELTINGAGFSTNANENIVYIKGNKSCDPDTTWQKAAVVSASATKLVIKVPFVKKSNGVPCGNDWGRVRVTVGSKSVLRDEAVKFVGPLEISLCHPYGVTIGTYPNTFRPGEISVMSAHLYTLYTRESGYYDKIKISVNGGALNIKDSLFTGATCSGFRFMLDAATFSDLNNCAQPAGYGGGAARKFTFIGRVDGTNFADTTECYIFNQPNMTITGSEGASQVSKSGGGNPTVKVKGKHMYFTKVAWKATGENVFHTTPPGVNLAATEVGISIPLSLMTANKTYTAAGITECGLEVTLFSIGVTP